MEGQCSSNSTSASLTASFSCSSSAGRETNPRSLPPGLDLYGKRRQMVQVQALEREIRLLQEELKSLEGLQPASACCKELEAFLEANPDPFIAVDEETLKRHHCLKRMWGGFCSKLAWICCCNGCCMLHQDRCPCCPSCNSQRLGCSCLKKMNCPCCCTCLCL